MLVWVKQELVSTIVAISSFVLLITISSISMSITQPEQEELSYSFVTQWGLEDSGPGEIYGTKWCRSFQKLMLSKTYALQTMKNHRIQVFDSNGAYITSWESEGTGDGQIDKA
jgi:hypothetical protein